MKKFLSILTMLLFFVACVFIGAWGGTYLLDMIEPLELGIAVELLVLWGILLLFYLFIFLQLVAHEAGHLLFGLLTGYRFLSFRIGSFMWVKQGDNIRLKRFKLKGTGGQCLMGVPEKDPMPVFLYNMGGVIVNLTLATLAFAVSLIPMPVIPQFVLRMFALIGVMLGLTNGIPLSLDLDNDGKNAFSLGKHPDSLQAFKQQLQINEGIQSGRRLKDLPEAWFEPSETDNALCNAICMFRFSRLTDAGKDTEAIAYGETLLETRKNMLPFHRNALQLELLWLELVGEGNPEKIEKLYTKQTKKILAASATQISGLRVQYAVDLLLENNPKKAAKTLEKFHTLAKKYPHQSEIETEMESIERTSKRSQNHETDI